MLNRILKTLILATFALVFSTAFMSCQKAKDTIGIIIVKDINGDNVAGAKVVLHQDGAISPQGETPLASLRKKDITDANGRAEFTYALEAILQVDVEKQEGNNTYTGTNVIRLLKEKTVTQVVEIN
tara:strand:+ start:307 stop:684 length:378 start_codon:yes stop_codon:yes gene_type:complete